MSLTYKKKSNELLNKYYMFERVKNEYENIIPYQLESKKQELITVINEIKSCECYEVEATDKEKIALDTFLANLNKTGG